MEGIVQLNIHNPIHEAAAARGVNLPEVFLRTFQTIQ
jgi:hypothetical protein